MKIISYIGVLIIIMVSPALAWVKASPDEAIFFEDANFKGTSLKLLRQPGMRHKLLPTMGELDKKISSVILGENIKVIVFTKPNFAGAARVYLHTIAEDMPDDDQIASLIVCPKNEPPQGVLFIQKRISDTKASTQRQWHYLTGQGVFFPLPESAPEQEATFPHIMPEFNDRVRFIYVSPGVETELFVDPEFGGGSLSLPGPDSSSQTVFDLSKYGFFSLKKSPPGVVSSLKVRIRSGGPK